MLELSREERALKGAFHNSDDIVFREVFSGMTRTLFVFSDGMIDVKDADIGVVKPLCSANGAFTPDLDGLKAVFTTVQKLDECRSRSEFVEKVARGALGLVIDGAESYFVLNLHCYPTRSIQEPPTSAVVKGPREGFTEDFKANMVMLRRRFGSGKLVFKPLVIGRVTKTQIRICYVKGITDMRLVDKIVSRLTAFDIDGVVDSSELVAFLEERPYSVFKQVGSTEKPDILTQKLLDGRVGIIVDGSPMVLTLPFMLVEDFHDSEDYYRRPVRTALIRILRLLGVFFAVLLPSVYVALTSYQYQFLPVELMVTILNATQGIPFSPIVEMLIALVFFEVLGEASVRMPRYFGMAISVVGGIILGETAVSAGVMSSLTVLIVAMSGIGLFAIPDEVGTFAVIRIALVLVGATLGLFGVVLASVALIARMASLNLNGVDYLAPFAPVVAGEIPDAVTKLSKKDSFFRTRGISKNKRRLKYVR